MLKLCRIPAALAWALGLMASPLGAATFFDNLSSESGGLPSDTGSGSAVDFPAYDLAVAQRFEVPIGGFTITDVRLRIEEVEANRSFTVKIYNHDSGNNLPNMASPVTGGTVYSGTTAAAGLTSGAFSVVEFSGLTIALTAGNYWLVVENVDAASDSAFDWDYSLFSSGDFADVDAVIDFDDRNAISIDGGATWPEFYDVGPFQMELKGNGSVLYTTLKFPAQEAPGAGPDGNPNLAIAQQFTLPTGTNVLTEISLLLKEVESGRTITIGVHEDNAGVPAVAEVSGGSIYSAPTSGLSGLSTSEFREVTLGGLNISLSGGTYWIVVKNADAVTDSAIDWNYNLIDAVDGIGDSVYNAISYDDGATWPYVYDYSPLVMRLKAGGNDVFNNMTFGGPGEDGTDNDIELGGEELRMAQKFVLNQPANINFLSMSLKAVEPGSNFAVKIYGHNLSSDQPQFAEAPKATIGTSLANNTQSLNSSTFTTYGFLSFQGTNLVAGTYWLVVESEDSNQSSSVDWEKSGVATGGGTGDAFNDQNAVYDEGEIFFFGELSANPYRMRMLGNFFSSNNSETLTGVASPAAGGTVSLGESGTPGSNVTADFTPGTDVRIEATPVSGYRFDGWTGDLIDDPASAITTVFMDYDKTVTASFVKISQVTLNDDPDGAAATLSVGGEGASFFFDEGESVSLVTTPTVGYRFSHWGGDTTGIADVNNASTTLTVQAADADITAHFIAQSQVILDDSPSGAASSLTVNGTAGSGIFDEGVPVTLVATSSSGYQFTNWSGDTAGINDINSASTTLTVQAADASIVANFSPIADVSLSASPVAGASSLTADGNANGGTFIVGSSVELVATPATGYRFESWSGDTTGIADVNSASTTLAVQAADADITAIFVLTSQINLVPSPSAGSAGLAAGGQSAGPGQQLTGDFDESSVISLTATPAAGYVFGSWTGDTTGIASSGSASTTLTVQSANAVITANFIQLQTVLLQASPTAGAVSLTADGNANGGSFPAGQTVELVATPAAGYRFVQWTGNTTGITDVNSATTDLVIQNSAATITAVFQATTDITLAPSPPGGTTGLTVQGPSGPELAGSGTFDEEVTVIVRAYTAAGFRFDGWTGPVSFADAGSEQTQFTVPASNATITANFAATSTVTLSASPTSGSDGQTVGGLPDGGTFDEGATIALVATPKAGWEFDGWTGDTATVENAALASTTLIVPTDNTDITANYRRAQNAITLESNPVEGADSLTADGEAGGGTFDVFDTVTIVATPAAGYRFDNWSGDTGTVDDASSATTTMTVPLGGASLTANFVKTSVVALTPNPGAGVSSLTVNGQVNSGEFDEGSTVTIVATATAGYRFSGWSDPSGLLSDAGSASTTLTVPSGNILFEANFTAQSTVSLSGTPMGAADALTADGSAGGGLFDEGSSIALVATAASGYEFVNWSGDTAGIVDVNSATTSLIVQTPDASIVANFTEIGSGTTPGYNAWLSRPESGLQGQGANTGPTDNFDGGALNNLAEYAFFTDASDAGDETPYRATAVSGNFVVSMTLANDPYLIYTVATGSSPGSLSDTGTLTYSSGNWTLEGASGLSLGTTAANGSFNSDVQLTRLLSQSSRFFVQITVAISGSPQIIGTAGYTSWLSTDTSGLNGEAENIQPTDNFDAGALNNLEEYAFFTNAADASDETPYRSSTQSGDFVVLMTLPKDPDITFTLASGSSPTSLTNTSTLTYTEGSPGSWAIDDADAGVILDSAVENGSDAGFTDIVISRDTASSTRFFIQITVSINP